jgi:hypothetical protein
LTANAARHSTRGPSWRNKIPCPTCGKTLQCLASGSETSNYFWCPICGSLCLVCKADGSVVWSDRPILVSRCRALVKQSDGGPDWAKALHAAAIEEAVFAEGERTLALPPA